MQRTLGSKLAAAARTANRWAAARPAVSGSGFVSSSHSFAKPRFVSLAAGRASPGPLGPGSRGLAAWNSLDRPESPVWRSFASSSPGGNSSGPSHDNQNNQNNQTSQPNNNSAANNSSASNPQPQQQYSQSQQQQSQQQQQYQQQHQQQYQQQQQQQRRQQTTHDYEPSGISNERLATWMFVMGVATLGASYVAVPLYSLFCRVTGFGGSPLTDLTASKLDGARELVQKKLGGEAPEVRVKFVTHVGRGLDWDFVPCQDYVTVKLGEPALAFFNVRNNERHAVTGFATYNVTPDVCGRYFNKIQCFCFDEQRVRAGEEVDMPVFFFVDPQMALDRNTNFIRDVTLSYQFFRIEDEEMPEGADDGLGFWESQGLPNPKHQQQQQQQQQAQVQPAP